MKVLYVCVCVFVYVFMFMFVNKHVQVIERQIRKTGKFVVCSFVVYTCVYVYVCV